MKKLLKNLFKNFLQKTSRGFTLIELLVVIAVLGVLAAIVLLAVNPAEQIKRGKDTARISAVTQIGRALQGYYTAQGAKYPPDGSAGAVATPWMAPLINSGDLKTTPANSDYNGGAPVPNCSLKFQSSVGAGNGGGYCYATNAAFTDAIVYTRLESTLNNTKGTCNVAAVPPVVAWEVFSTTDARAGVVCSSTEPVVGAQTFAP